MRRRNVPRLTTIFAGSAYGLGAVFIGWTKAGWRVAMPDGDTYTHTPSFLSAVRAARHVAALEAKGWDARDHHYVMQRG